MWRLALLSLVALASGSRVQPRACAAARGGGGAGALLRACAPPRTREALLLRLRGGDSQQIFVKTLSGKTVRECAAAVARARTSPHLSLSTRARGTRARR